MIQPYSLGLILLPYLQSTFGDWNSRAIPVTQCFDENFLGIIYSWTEKDFHLFNSGFIEWQVVCSFKYWILFEIQYYISIV